jgi:hypothetical protein
MKRLIFLILLFSEMLNSQTALQPGDIAVIGFKTNNNTDGGVDAIKLVTLVDLECNTKFIVTDNGWKSSAPAGWACDNNEFGLEITCNTSISAGSVFYIGVDAAGDAAICSGGTISKTSLGGLWGTDFGLSSQADNIFVLQGTRATPVFIFGVINRTSWTASPACDKQLSGLPVDLTEGTSALRVASSQNQWHYNCSVNNNTKNNIRSSISNSANWVSTSGQQWNTETCVFSVSGGIIQSGVMAVSGSGCGYTNGCLLAYSGSVNSASVAGNCSSGYQNMSKSITVPSGCTYSVTAEMKPRPMGCPDSGADGSCQTCDVVKVDILGGSKTFQQGASNSSLIDSYSATGPATVVVSGKANRADEIITYNVLVTPCACVTTLLPVELISFYAEKKENSVELTWSTANEINNEFYVVEKSKDSEFWETLYITNTTEDSYTIKTYSIFDSSPYDGISYYRLKQVDRTGIESILQITSIDFNKPQKNLIKQINIFGQEINSDSKGLIIKIYDNGETEKLFISQ